jgi:hypothetical protein
MTDDDYEAMADAIMNAADRGDTAGLLAIQCNLLLTTLRMMRRWEREGRPVVVGVSQ